ncbi:MAG: lipoate--protein ligase family protein, partial [Spirochaetales bacterium]|nr:lipoate--protein ligase family protein [Spirochaetales bacterium]
MKHNVEMLTENKTLYVYQSDIDVYNAMAIDEYLLQCVSSGEYSTAVHIYSWGRPGITLGRFTPSDVIKTPCSIDVTRRITGGNALYHKDDIAYGIVMKLSDNKNVGLELCKKVSKIIQNVFSAL